ncbi:MAG TPA: hypothetical protein DHU89_03865 [Flavobacteriales bacterium]|nr:hypothetical protein [Flavobacteriales bacterium]|tara:strand:- start:217 stop:417 length:201 start_codon:yes stop_codon:yes gene_type:complete
MVNFTLDDLASFSRTEQKLINEVMGIEDNTPLLSPRKETINNILGYSKALSIKDSMFLNKTDLMLN